MNSGLVDLLGGVQKPIYSQIDELHMQIGAFEARLEFTNNLGSTLGEALTSAEQVRLSQIARVRDEIEPIKRMLATWDREILIGLHNWAHA